MNRQRRRLELRRALKLIGPAALLHAVDTEALIFAAPDYIGVPVGVDMPATLVEWVERIGTVPAGDSTVDLYFLSDDIAHWAAAQLAGKIGGGS